jgi:hypothetical protein
MFKKIALIAWLALGIVATAAWTIFLAWLLGHAVLGIV